MKELSNRSANFTDSVIRRMTRVANKYGAVNLSQGFPDFDPPKAITDRLARVAGEGPHQYALTWGAKNFRDAVAKKYEHFSGVKIDPETEIVVTCGSTEAMMATMLSITNPGDKVVIFSPFYENYGADTVLSGAEPIYVPLVPPEFHFDKEKLEDAFRQGAKALILCNPSNPCGKVFTMEEMQTIAELAKKYDVYVVTDEVYEHIVYAPNKHIYMQALEGMRERTIVCNSLSKTYSITGWRLGYVIANPQIIDRVKKVHDFLTVGSMGHSSSIALGIAMNKLNQKVWCIDGDGAALMHMGSMAVVGSSNQKNMVHIVINNGAHETVGGMPTVASKIDLCKIAKGCGYDNVMCASNVEELDKVLKNAKKSNELCFIEVKAAIGARENLGRPTTTAIENKDAFMEFLKE